MTTTITPVAGYEPTATTITALTPDEEWSDVTAPDAAFSWMPFTPEKHYTGTTFRAPASFDIQDQAGVSVTKTYYLDTVNGNNANSGLTAALAKATWNEIMGLGDYDRVYILDGSKLVRASSTLQPARNIEVIGVGTVRWTSERPVGSFTLTAGQTYTYQAAVTGGEYTAWVRDFTNLDVYGNPKWYTVKNSVAEVEAAAGSIYWAGGTLYVHTVNGLTPTGQNLQYGDSQSIAWGKDGITRYIENITFEGGSSQSCYTSAGGAKAYYKDCTFYGGGVFHGLDECIFENCIGNAYGDFANYDVEVGVLTHFVEINCDFGEILGDTTNQPSTSHNACVGVRLNGEYHHATGQACADVGASQVWMLACSLHDTTDGLYLGGAGGKAWLDTCTISACSGNGINVEAGATVYTRSLTNTEGTTGAGTITTY
jgi:hypothetical protein